MNLRMEAHWVGFRRTCWVVACAGTACGSLDGALVCIYYSSLGSTPAKIFRPIATSVLGRAAVHEGLWASGLGLVLHFWVAYIAATIFYWCSLICPIVARKAYLFAPIFGENFYFVMVLAVLPFTALPPSRFPPPIGF